MDAAFIPEVNSDLDTQNFEKFEEMGAQVQTSTKSGPWRKMLPSKDANFVGYTYKNVEIANEHHLPGIAELRKKSTAPKRPSVKSLFETPSPPDPPTKGSYLNLLPTQLEEPESPVPEHQSIRSAQYFRKHLQR
ncbi:uncharacterized protein LOC110427354 [Herrania umbratica]|uniref:Uncharacterized protein LOC110427354 n=1 Tax=Herrania umbratica TaxID=108875 RepID=A0A6J1BGU7_9ROSI|nr:uncharacterized protein LOC110427354 [Herrania umbratica]